MVLFTGDFEKLKNSGFNANYGYGLKLFIYNQSSIFLSFNDMVRIKTGQITYIKLKKRITRSLPSPYSDCQDLENVNSDLVRDFLQYKIEYTQAFDQNIEKIKI
jgi:hypothetical protein